MGKRGKGKERMEAKLLNRLLSSSSKVFVFGRGKKKKEKWLKPERHTSINSPLFCGYHPSGLSGSIFSSVFAKFSKMLLIFFFPESSFQYPDGFAPKNFLEGSKRE